MLTQIIQGEFATYSRLIISKVRVMESDLLWS